VPFWRPRGCVLWLDFLEPKGDTVYDKSGYDNHGTIYGATRVGALGRYGLSFDGVDDYVEVPHNNSLMLHQGGSIEAIVRHREFKSANGILLHGNDYVLFSRDTKRIHFSYYDGTVWREPYSEVCLELNKWQHLVAAWVPKPAEGITEIRFFCDGKPVGVKDAPNQPVKDEVPLYIAWGWEPYIFFKGPITVVRVYNRALSEREIRANHAYFFSRIKRAV